MTEPIILQGYSYPPLPLADVIAYEARQGRMVKFVIQHAGGWAVSGEAYDITADIVANELMSELAEIYYPEAEYREGGGG